jgi:hypothetical protein
MSWATRSYVGLSLVLASALGAGEASPNITVFIYNYAAISSEVLAQTEREAARIYKRGSIDIQWLDCPLSSKEASRFPACQVPVGPTTLVVRILSQSMAERLRLVRDSHGFALSPDDGSFAITANVFAYDAEQLAHSRGVPDGVILGNILAHELGHLLLGSGSHSRTGIMHVPWHQKELGIVGQGMMTFTPEELKKMRADISVRMGREAAVNTALVPECTGQRRCR